MVPLGDFGLAEREVVPSEIRRHESAFKAIVGNSCSSRNEIAKPELR
ncbi:hypothetical protein GCM10023155_30880 [Bremerella cremea]